MTQDIIETGRRIAESYNVGRDDMDPGDFGEHDLNEDCDDA